MSLKIYETFDLLIQVLGIYPVEFTNINKDEMVGWHHQLDECEFEQAPELVMDREAWPCCGPWGGKEWNMTGQLNLSKDVFIVAVLATL